MSETSKNPSKSRRRGRPPGASRLNEADMAVLRKVAPHFVRQPDARFTVLLGKVMTKPSETEVRRLRAKWHDHRDDLVEETIAAYRNQNWASRALASYTEMDEWVMRIAQAIPLDALGQMTRKIAEGADLIRTLEEPRQPPFDLEDPEAIGAAIARFEMEAINSQEGLETLLPEDMLVSDIPDSFKHYFWAVMNYQLHLQAKAKEDEAEQQAVRGTSSDDHRAGGSHG